MRKIKVAICGGLGRMGKILVNKIKKNPSLILSVVTDVKKKKISNKIFTRINKINEYRDIDVIIDFSNPENTIRILKFAKILKKKIVIGTTGFNLNQNNLIKNYSKKIAIFKSGNMSLGINLLTYITKILSKKIPNNFQIGIIDDHHQKKIDYPSGTALMLGNKIAEGKNKHFQKLKGKIFLNKDGNLQKNKINFFIKRKGKTVGNHAVIYSNQIEKIELRHTAFSRELFAEGALNAAIWISKKKNGLFDMHDMLSLK
jgi:4-hydroxy-tetrahydrodipicolinate reductase